jgi:hypothetical protein
MRLEAAELVILLMLSLDGRGWATLAGRRVARLGSFSPSGVACLEDCFGMVNAGCAAGRVPALVLLQGQRLQLRKRAIDQGVQDES